VVPQADNTPKAKTPVNISMIFLLLIIIMFAPILVL